MVRGIFKLGSLTLIVMAIFTGMAATEASAMADFGKGDTHFPNDLGGSHFLVTCGRNCQDGIKAGASFHGSKPSGRPLFTTKYSSHSQPGFSGGPHEPGFSSSHHKSWYSGGGDKSGYSGHVSNISADKRSVSTVPEPATWIMMIVGFWIVGWRLKRSRSITARQIPVHA